MPRNIAKFYPEVPPPPEGVTSAKKAVAASSTKTRTVRGKRGGLKVMPTMPLDILLEIFSHLHPRDLLSLARTNKPFRDFLMSRASSSSLWRASRRNVEGLPDCPPHLSEPAYANLAFSPYCHGCDKTNIHSIIWEWGVRYCNTCKKRLCTEYFNVMRFRNKTQVEGVTPLELLTTGILAPGRDYGSMYQLYHTAEVLEINEAVDRLSEDMEGLREYVENRKNRIKVIREHAALCARWQAQKVASRATELERVRKARLNAIVARLRDMGWSQDLDKMGTSYYPLTRHPDVRVSRQLTDRGWLKIRDKLVAVMQTTQSRRLLNERRELLKARLRLFGIVVNRFYASPRRTEETELQPGVTDIAVMPEVRRLLDVPSDIAVTLETLEPLRDELPTLIQRWQTEIREGLTQMLSQKLGNTHSSRLLDLAISYFECRVCKWAFRYPEVLAHRCPRSHGNSYGYDDTIATAFEWAIHSNGHPEPWSSTVFTVDHALEFSSIIVRVCGKDPDHATRQEMDAWGLRLCYVRKSAPERRLIVPWRDAILHEWHKRRHEFQPEGEREWTIAPQEDIDQAKAIEAFDKSGSHFARLASSVGWSCSLCTDGWNSRAQTISIIKMHLRLKHLVEDPTIANGDMYFHPDCKPRGARQIWRLPARFQDEVEEAYLDNGERAAKLKGDVYYV